MKKHFYLLTVAILMFSGDLYAQKISGSANGGHTEEVSIYPNPVTGGKLYVSTSSDKIKQIEIYDVLGKKMVDVTTYSNKEINIAHLSSGVYIITIKEDSYQTTRKLVVR